MKYFSVVLILVFSLTVSSQNKKELNNLIDTFPDKEKYSVEYDKTQNQLQISYRAFKLKADKGSKVPINTLTFGVSVFIKGEEITDSIDEFFLVFSSLHRSNVFSDNHFLTFTADNKEFSMNEGNYNKKTLSSWNAGGISEVMFYKVNRKTLETIADSKSIEFKLGDFRGSFGKEERKMLKNILALTNGQRKVSEENR